MGEAADDRYTRQSGRVSTNEPAPSREMPPGPQLERPCPICGSRVDWGGSTGCARCGAVAHETCYYGRVASLEEWLEFLRWADSDEAPLGAPAPDALCSACRTTEGA